MKKFLLFALFLASSAAFAEASPGNEYANNQTIEITLKHSQESQQNRCADKKISLAEVAVNKQLEKRGCCSWHGGVCGCSSGRVVCCDGNLSPSCGC